MDKQIIIDRVDVTDCEYCSRYANTTIYHCDWTGECKEHPNCHYKQLKRKEQECEELKNFHINLVGVKECEIKELLKLKQTLAEIKEIAEDQKDVLESMRIDIAEQILNKISEVVDENI